MLCIILIAVHDGPIHRMFLIRLGELIFWTTLPHYMHRAVDPVIKRGMMHDGGCAINEGASLK